MWKTTPTPPPSKKLDRDPRLFMAFLTLVVLVMYAQTLLSNTAVREPVRLIPFSVLICLHLYLHWILERIADRPRLVAMYIFSQGALAFTIIWISGNVGMIFALFMGLIGEVIGLLGITRWGILAAVYYLLLSAINFMDFLGLNSAGWWALGTMPTVIAIALYVRMYIRQLEARSQAQTLLEDLEKANRQLTEYADRVEDLTIAGERQRMARELHDTLSQGLAGLILQLEAVDAHLANNNAARARSIIQEMMERARTTLADARRAIEDLRQPVPTDVETLIHREAERFAAATDIPLHLEIALPEDLSDLHSEIIIRIVRESLTNIVRHANARNASLVICREAGANELRIEIRDDGIGFDPAGVETGHYGLVGMRERVRLAGGGFELHASPGKGTQLLVRLPLQEPAHE